MAFRPSLEQVWNNERTNPLFHKFNISVLAFLILLALILAMAPPVKTDALVYHLAIPKAYLENHGIINLPNSMYSFFPLLFEMIFLFAMTFGVESLPALCGLGMTFLLLTGLGVFFHQYISPRLAWFVPVLFFSTPTFLEISASAYIDLSLAGFMFFTFYAWGPVAGNPSPLLVFLYGLVCGRCLGNQTDWADSDSPGGAGHCSGGQKR